MITKQDAEALFEPQVINGIIEGVVTSSAVLSKFRRLPNMTSNKTKMRVLDSLPMAYWVDADTNNGRKKLTKAAWDKKFIVAEELAVIVPIKEDVLDDADYDIWGDLRPRIVEAFHKKIDSAILMGDDRPSGFREDLITSVLNAGAVIDQGQNQSLYSAINDAMEKVELSGYDVNGILGGVGLKSKFRMMVDTTGQPITGTEIGSLPRTFVDNGSWDAAKVALIVGDFSQAVYAIRQDVTYKVLTEAIIQDPATGDILYNLAQDDMVALRVTMRLGWEIPNPINALSPDESVRFPFAAIKSYGTSGVTTQNVTFTVTDGASDPVEDVKINLAGVVGKTNASGQVVLKAQAGTYEYTAKKGDAKAKGTVTVASSAVSVNIVNF